MAKGLNKGIKAFNKDSRKKGKIIAVLPNGDYKVEVIVKQDKETGERTTKLEDWKESTTVKYRKLPKRKADLRNYKVDNVRKFHKAFKHPVAYKPTVIKAERALNRTIWTGEELVEFLHASSKDKDEFTNLFESFLNGLDNAYKKSMKSDTPKTYTERLVAQADALTDAQYFIDGTFVESGVNPLPLFDIVQRANMGKLHNGVPKYREDGKILKPDNWFELYAPEPRLKEEIKKQLNN